MASTTNGTRVRPRTGAEPSGGTGPSGAPWWQLALPGLAVGAVAALYRLDRKGLWVDEAFTLGAVHQLRSAVPKTSWTMSAYYAPMRLWFVVSESVWWMRFASVLAALVALALTVVAARRLAGPRRARLAGLLLALSPMWVAYAREARSYAVVMVVVVLAWIAVDHGVSDADPRHRRWWWLLHTALAAVLPLLHGLSVLQLAPHLGLLVVARADRATWARALRGVGAALLLTLALARTASAEVGEWVPELSLEQLGFNLQRFLGPYPVVSVALGLLVLAGAAVCAQGALRAETAIDRARAATPILWAFGPLALLVLISIVRPSFVPRYAIGCVPGLALLMAAAVDRAGGDRPERATARIVVGGAVVVALIAGQVHAQTRPLDGWTVVARRIAADAQPGDTILLSREATTRPVFEAAWRDVDPAHPPAVIPVDRPLGEVLRFEPDETDNTVRWNEARKVGRVWVVGDTIRQELDRLPSLTVDGVAGRPATHREVGRWHGEGSSVYAVLLEPI